MLKRALAARQSYPPQFYLILAGLLFSTIGTSMVFPFLTIYVSERLALPLAEVTTLITLNGAVAIFASFAAGPLTDRFGRKWIMVASLAGSGATYYLLGQATTYLAFALLMGTRGIFFPLYRIGTNAMVSDLIEPERRAEAFALVRTSDNVGIAIGPAIGGFMVAISYSVSFTIAAAALIIFGIVVAVFARETVPTLENGQGAASPHLGGYGDVIRDRALVYFILAFTLFRISSVMLWSLSAVYAKQNYQLSESLFGFIPMTNALMVVLFQVGVTRITKRYRPLPVMALGTLIYSLGVGSMAFGTGFWGFWTSFVVLTVGELILMPTSTTYVADLAPLDMRGRYMSFFSFAQGISRSVAPLFGGLLNDNIGPKAIWYGGGAAGLSGTVGYVLLIFRERAAARKASKDMRVSEAPTAR